MATQRTIVQPITADQFFDLPEVPGKRFELIDGELTEMPTSGGYHAGVVSLVLRFLFSLPDTDRFGHVFADGLDYRLSRNPDTVKIPDVSFVRRNRLTFANLPDGFPELAPDLAVEVVSPHDRASEVYAKVRDYLAAGTEVVWVFWPPSRSVSVHHADGTARDLQSDDDVELPPFLPSARFRVGDLFPN